LRGGEVEFTGKRFVNGHDFRFLLTVIAIGGVPRTASGC
jgi:hypothetical protein